MPFRTFLAALLLTTTISLGQNAFSPADNLPDHITRITHFGQRADWSHDGKRILFMERTFGDAFEVELSTGIIRPVTHHYFHEGYTRALYLANGDILLSGAPQFDAEDPWVSRRATAELWVLDKSLTRPPVRLGARCSEGPAVSRHHLKIAWAVDHDNEPEKIPEDVSQVWLAEIKYDNGVPRLINTKVVLDDRDLDFKVDLETQNFRPPEEKELTLSAYGHQGTDVIGLNLETGKVTNYSNTRFYEEPEGIYPDGQHTLVECDRHNGKGSGHVDLWKIRLDGSGQGERLTFFSDYPEGKASNPVVSDDGRFIAFQMARASDAAGIGYGIFIYDIEKAAK
jgi:hypothetical protein